MNSVHAWFVCCRVKIPFWMVCQTHIGPHAGRRSQNGLRRWIFRLPRATILPNAWPNAWAFQFTKSMWSGTAFTLTATLSNPGRCQRSQRSGILLGCVPRKGLDTLVDAFIIIRKRNKAGRVRLRVGGSCGPADDLFVAGLRGKLQAEGLLEDVDFARNVAHDSKIDFLKSISVFSVPARYGEAFGLYLIEALAAGVPVVQPRCASFPQLVEATGGGFLFEPENPEALAMAACQQLLMHPQKAHGLGETGRKAVRAHFSSEAMAQTVLKLYQKVRTADLVEKV